MEKEIIRDIENSHTWVYVPCIKTFVRKHGLTNERCYWFFLESKELPEEISDPSYKFFETHPSIRVVSRKSLIKKIKKALMK